MIEFLYITTVSISPELIKQVAERCSVPEAEIKEYVSTKGKPDRKIDDAFAWFGVYGVRKLVGVNGFL